MSEIKGLRDLTYSDASKTFRDAIDAWGIDAQIGMAVEEMAELIVALQQRRRGRASDQEIIDEIADVLIMAAQLRYIFDPDLVDSRIDEKMTRLRKRLAPKA